MLCYSHSLSPRGTTQAKHPAWRRLAFVLALFLGFHSQSNRLRAQLPVTTAYTPALNNTPAPSGDQASDSTLPAPQTLEAPSSSAVPNPPLFPGASVPPSSGVPGANSPTDAAPSTAPPYLPPGSVARDPVSSVWGIVGLLGFPYGQTIASNGMEYNQLFSLDLNFNIWLWRAKRVYAYTDSTFWGQKAAPGITNPTQGAFDFSKREFDFLGGVAWNYAGKWEARVFAYSTNNLNRGYSPTTPVGFNDGVGLENRYYLNPTYYVLGTPAFDKARNTFLSIGYYPTKTMIDGKGFTFKPGAFCRAYLIWEILGPKLYLYTDDTFLTDNTMRPAMFTTDSGIAYRPFVQVPRLEFRLGSQDLIDMLDTDAETSAYIAVRWIF